MLSRRPKIVGTAYNSARSRSCTISTVSLRTSFGRYFEKAARMKGVTGENLLLMLEQRRFVYRLGLASSGATARQLVRHGHIQVSGRNVIPSFVVVPGRK